jgi:hypothetical protein
MIKKILTDYFTERDGKSFCPVRLMAFIAFFWFLILSTIELKQNCRDFSLVDMASGISILIGIISAGIGIKNKSDS